MGMHLFLNSSLADRFDISHVKTNVRKSNVNKGRLDLSSVSAFFGFFGRLLSALVRFRPVVAYYPITATQVGWIGRDTWCLLLCRIFGVATVVHMRGSHFRLNYDAFNPMVQRLVRFALKGVSLALVQADYLRAQFSGLIEDDRIQLLRNAIDTSEYDNADLSAYEHKNVLYIGHLTKAKGYCDLARAIPIVARRIPGVRFHFAGTLRKGERNVFFNQLTGEPVGYEDPTEAHEYLLGSEFRKNYVFHDVVFGDEKVELLRSAAVFVSPSYSEGFSRALLEAMSVGKAIVCTPVGAHKEQLVPGENALIVAPGDINALADAICRILEDKALRETMAANNFAYARSSFDAEPVASQLGDYLQTVALERQT